ncbi:PspC domain-containing protein [Corynebacterium aurimucosum]|uniref:PspC domain-containing protein n=2 Tax=Corynebacteriaceae TaxID=1653 RepID=A0A558IWJ8_9CORY|nr:histidine kinase [Corynebacterium sp. HMSC074E01]OFP63317.1 histidine kinase [Corynebacterium sp. HMSC074C01]OHO61609.1 histidine kinase [Corynebacterium sp. HMSC036D02]TVU85682.1 PspC domain-containing protein [Corynebacterium aurimucosum]
MSSMTSPYVPAENAAPYPVMSRPQSGRVVAGVAAGLAQNLGVSALSVRIALTALTLLGGVGAMAYAGLWIFTPALDDAPSTRRSPLSLVLVFLALAGSAVGVLGVSGASLSVAVPLAVVAIGAVLAWLAYDRGLNTPVGLVAVAAGAVLVIGGVVVAAVTWESGSGSAILATALTLVGFGALVVPLVLKLWRSLSQEQAAKAVSEERAEIAARLHDSVLQTLALIQKRAGDSREVTRLARAQERELRAWLFDAPSAAPTTCFGALEAACGEVEDLFDIRVSAVTVGEDTELTESAKLLIQAAREAMVNAGKHAGVDVVDVYAELLAGELSIFVRDRGVGFDVENIPADRHGIRDSIRARVEGSGGRVRISSTPGEGTEVELAVAL